MISKQKLVESSETKKTNNNRERRENGSGLDELASSAAITQAISSLNMGIFQKKEFLKLSERTLKDIKFKAKSLSLTKCKSFTLRDELRARNKMNANNLECLFQTKNELDKLRCDLKTEYIVASKARKVKTAKYKSTISSFHAQWKNMQRSYEEYPEVKSLASNRKLNQELEEEFQKLKKTAEMTQVEHETCLQQTRLNIKKKIAIFAEEAFKYEKCLQIKQKCDHQHVILKNLEEEIGQLKQSNQPKVNLRVNFFKAKLGQLDKSEIKANISEDSAVDISAFDDISVPTENLEVANEDDLFLFTNKEDENANAELQTTFQSDLQSSSQGSQAMVLHIEQEGLTPEQNAGTGVEMSQYWNAPEEADSEPNDDLNDEESQDERGRSELEQRATESTRKRAGEASESEPAAKLKMSQVREDRSETEAETEAEVEYQFDENYEMSSKEAANNELTSFDYEEGSYGSPFSKGSPFSPQETSTLLSPAEPFNVSVSSIGNGPPEVEPQEFSAPPGPDPERTRALPEDEPRAENPEPSFSFLFGNATAQTTSSIFNLF